MVCHFVPLFVAIADMTRCTKHTVCLFLANFLYNTTTTSQTFARFSLVVSARIETSTDIHAVRASCQQQ